MDHAYAEEHDLVESYLADRLSDGEREAFEAHYFACAECLAQLEAASGFRDGMRSLAAEAAAAHARAGLLAGLVRLFRGRRLAAGALALAVLVALGVLAARNQTLERRLAAALEAPAAAPAPAGGDPRVAALEAQVRSLEQAAGADRGRLEQELAAARRALAAAEEAAGRPRVNVPVFVLASVRGAEAGAEPVNRLQLPVGADSAVLTSELATADFPVYRATLLDAGGREVWQAEGLVSDGRNQLVLLLPAAMIPPGTYQLTIDGLRPGRQPFAVAVHPFRVVSPGG